MNLLLLVDQHALHERIRLEQLNQSLCMNMLCNLIQIFVPCIYLTLLFRPFLLINCCIWLYCLLISYSFWNYYSLNFSLLCQSGAFRVRSTGPQPLAAVFYHPDRRPGHLFSVLRELWGKICFLRRAQSNRGGQSWAGHFGPPTRHENLSGHSPNGLEHSTARIARSMSIILFQTLINLNTIHETFSSFVRRFLQRRPRMSSSFLRYWPTLWRPPLVEVKQHGATRKKYYCKFFASFLIIFLLHFASYNQIHKCILYSLCADTAGGKTHGTSRRRHQ